MAELKIKVEFDREKFKELTDEFKRENPDFIEVVRCKDCEYSKTVDYREPKYRCMNIFREGCTQRGCK